MSIRSIAAAALEEVCLPVLAGRPLVTEDAGVLDDRRCEFETFAAHGSELGSPNARGWSVQFGCGFGWRSQIALAAAQARSAGLTERSFALLGKTAVHTSAAGTAYTLAWGLADVKPPGGSSKHETTFLNGVVSTPLAQQTQLHVNLGWSRSQSAHANTTNWALALERSLSGGVDVMGEVFATDRDRSPWLQVAARWALRPEHLFVDASWGFQTVSSRPKLLTVGLKLAF